MPMRYRWDDADDGSSSRTNPRRDHLCVVLDDWSGGCSIYKLDVADLDADLDLRAGHLSDPPLFRLEIPPDERGRYARFAAVGSRIFAISYVEEDTEAPVLVHNMDTGALAVGPVTPLELQHSPELVEAGGCLYAFDSMEDNRGQEHQSFKVLKRHGRRGWVWASLRVPPFDLARTTCHAAHPDGRHVFFSAHGSGTYSFNAFTEEWTRHGDWMLPFEGQEFYDDEVEAWVGLSRAHMDEDRVCACDVVGPGDGGAQPPPEWTKVVEEDMTQGRSERCLAVKLAHLGDGRFCLVEYLKRRGLPEDVCGEDCQLYATKFRLRYDKNGALRATRRRARCYTVRNKSNTFSFRAFGI